MSSCIMKNQDSDDEVDLEALRLAALKSRKPKYPRVNHSNLISIVPNTPETPDFANTKIKVEKVSPTPEDNVPGDNKDEKGSNFSENLLENTQDILSMDDKEEEDSLERIMDQLEAEISGKTPISSNKNSNEKKRSKKNKKDADDEIELVQIKTGREPGAIIEIRESASPETVPRNVDTRKSISPLHSKSPKRRSRSPFRSKSRSPLLRSRSYRRSRSPYGSKSPRRSRSPFRRSISPFWASRRSRSTSRKRSPFRRYKSPGRNRSPFSCFSRSRSRSFDRRRSSWSPSPRRRSKSPLYWDGYPPARRRNVYSPSERSRRSLTPRDGSKSPRRRSRSPRHYFRNSPYRRSRSPFKRLRSPVRRVKSPIRRSQSPLLRRSKSPNSKLNSPAKRSPHARSPMRSKSPDRRSFSPSKRSKPPERAPSKPRSKSPTKRHEASRRYQGRSGSKNERNFSFSTSPTARRNRSPLRAVEKNKLDANDKNEKPKDRRNEKRHRSLSRENNKRYDRRTHRQKYLRWFSPSRTRRSADRQRKKSKSPVKAKETDDKSKEEATKQSLTDKGTSPVSAVPLDPILEARKKKFENQNEVDPTVDKKISLKSIKESTEQAEDDDDALTINIESNLWDESEESEDEFESRFKSGDSKKKNNRTIFSFRNLREGDGSSAKMILNKPLTEENRRDRFGRTDRHDRWQNSRKNDRSSRRNRTYSDGNKKNDENDKNKSKNNEKNNFQTSNSRTEKRSDRKPIVWSSKDEKKPGKDLKDNEVTTTQSESKEEKSRNSEKTLNEKVGKDEADDFDKFISDFEKELESDNCISTNKVNSEGVKKPKISVKKNLFEPKANVESTVKKPTGGRTLKINESSHKVEKNNEVVDSRKDAEETNKVEVNESQPMNEGPEDYIEDDDFVLEESARRNSKNRVEEEDSSSDLRAVLSRRRNARLTKVVSLQENMPTRLVQSAFQGLGNKKSRKQVREVQDSLQFSSFEKNIKNTGEGRRVLLLQREKNPSLPYIKCAVPDSNPDTTVYQRLTRSSERKRKHKLKMQLEPVDDMDQEEYEEDVFEVEEEKQSRRFRLKRNVTLSSQGDSEHPFPSYLYIR